MRKFISVCYRVLKSPWALLIFSLGVLAIGIFAIGDLGSRFQVDSWAAGIILGLGFECFGDAVGQLLSTTEKENDSCD